jgi:uncharacterized phage-associated protein
MKTTDESVDKEAVYKPQRVVKQYAEGIILTNFNSESAQIEWITEANSSYSFKKSYEVSVFDVAAYILNKNGEMSTMKLHKLLYYSQAWSMVWDERELFTEKIEAWANGPVVPQLFAFHKGTFLLSSIVVGNPDRLSVKQRETVDAVLAFYGDKSAQWLINLTHSEKPWLDARIGLDQNERGKREISPEVLAEYYSSL